MDRDAFDLIASPGLMHGDVVNLFFTTQLSNFS